MKSVPNMEVFFVKRSAFKELLINFMKCVNVCLFVNMHKLRLSC